MFGARFGLLREGYQHGRVLLGVSGSWFRASVKAKPQIQGRLRRRVVAHQ